MFELLTNEDKEICTKVSNYDVDDLIEKTKKNYGAVFNAERIVLNNPLNKLGLQPLKCLLAFRINEARQNVRIHKYNVDLLSEYRKNGLLVINDLFTEKDVHGQTIKVNDRYINLVQMTLGDDTIPVYNTLTLQEMPAFRGDDLQCWSHVDTFHPVLKVWVYLDDVTLNHAPFCYAGGTHLWTEKKLQFMFDLSNKLTNINEGDLRDINNGFPEPEPVCGTRFTTVFADVAGFHKRGNGKEGFVRRAAQGKNFRKNPFRNINE